MGDVGYGYLNTSMATGIGTGVGALAGIGIGSIASAVGAGALAGSAVPGIGTLIGAIVGLGAGIATMAATGSKTQKETEAFEAVKEYAKQNGTGFLKTEEDFVKALKEQSNISESVAKALYKNVDAIEEWIKVEKENAIITEAEWKTAFTTKNSANAIY